MRSIITFLLGSLGLMPITAFAEAKHSEVIATASKAGDQVAIEFKIKFPEHIAINHDGPWSLVFTKAPELKFSKAKWDLKDLSDSLPGFKVTTSEKPKAKAGTADYTATVFVCTKDKTQCYREVHKGSVNWAI